MTGWTSREADSGWDDHARLFNLCFRKRKDAATFRWKYERNPDGRAIARVATDADGHVVGAYAYVPRRFLRDGEPVVLMQASDAMTEPGWRGRGIFTGLDDEVARIAGEAGAPWAFAYSGRLSLKGFLRNGWEVVGHAPAYRRLYRTARALRRVPKLGRGLVALAPLADVVVGWRDRRALRLPDGPATVARLPRFDGRADELFEQTAPRRGLVGDRRADWLNWRYVDTPTGRQECFGVEREGRLDGWLVAELFDGHCYLVDHWARDGAAREALLAAFAVMGRERGAAEATALLFEHHPSVATLLRLGFRRPRGSKVFRDVFPYILRPIRADADDGDRAIQRWHLADGDRDAEHMSP